ncbi:MAG: bifunctional folylpolyglutamate synthase/dihydrofolate synthase [Coriobacteriales bacterium]|jgi:dihydrofolate synthase/folylpolyglutamate synthase|nr:bifunctional folylpolyglutamate synthase/dihydrofolate synthase [Coriobacteriales bacterium]
MSDTYKRALALLHDALRFGIDPSLVPITRILCELDDPHLDYPCIQVAGTNGKSSTARLIAALLRSQGLRVGLYTSPELVFYEERVELDGLVVSREDFACALLAAHGAATRLIAAGTIETVTEFELLTAAAFLIFSRRRVDCAVLECGLGGRWDATSVISPVVAVITGIGLDHTALLGTTPEQIAAEKAAIIKPGSLAVLGPGTAATREIFLARCAEVGVEAIIVQGAEAAARVGAEAAIGAAPVPVGAAAPAAYAAPVPAGAAAPAARAADTLHFPGPAYQRDNLATAIAAAEAARAQALDGAKAQAALDTLRIPGRFEILRDNPLFLIDAAHNPASAAALAQALTERFGLDEQGLLKAPRPDAAPLTLLLGVLADKDAAGIIGALAPLFAEIVLTQSSSARAIPSDELAALFAALTGFVPLSYPSVSTALDALTAAQAPLVVTGSITVAGEALAWMRQQP